MPTSSHALQNLDAYKPITMVFCCVDPAQYINAFDIGNVLAVATYTVWFSFSPLAPSVGMADPYPIPNSPPVSVCY